MKYHLKLLLSPSKDRNRMPAYLSVNGGPSIKIQPRHWRLILILFLARAADRKKRLPKPAVGWRSRSEIASAIDELNGFPVSVEAVGRYGSQLSAELRRATAGHDSRNPPLEKRPLQGYRLAEHVKVTFAPPGAARN